MTSTLYFELPQRPTHTELFGSLSSSDQECCSQDIWNLPKAVREREPGDLSEQIEHVGMSNVAMFAYNFCILALNGAQGVAAA